MGILLVVGPNTWLGDCRGIVGDWGLAKRVLCVIYYTIP